MSVSSCRSSLTAEPESGSAALGCPSPQESAATQSQTAQAADDRISSPQATGGPSSSSGSPEQCIPSTPLIRTSSHTSPQAVSSSSPSDIAVRFHDAVAPSIQGRPAADPPPSTPRPRRTIRESIRFFFSSQNQQGRKRLSNVVRVCIGFLEVVTIVVLSILSATKWRSKGERKDLSEWEACSSPVGTWNALWAGRVSLAIALGIWELRRDRRRDRQAINVSSRRADPESAGPVAYGQPPSSPVSAAPAQNDLPGDTSRGNTQIGQTARQIEPTASPQGTNVVFNRLETLVTALALGHFVVNHILLYGSLQSCRYDAPHVWWLGFGILCLGYLVVAEIVLIAFIVFILGPVLLFTLNVIMLCLGRPIDANGNILIKAEIPKMSQSEVDQVPLVIYIPARPSPTSDEPGPMPGDYPPKPQGPIAPATTSDAQEALAPAGPSETSFVQRVINFFRGKKPVKSADVEAPATKVIPEDTEQSEDAWEATFEKGEHPFVCLEPNRATCAICLVDFVAPRKRDENQASGLPDTTASPVPNEPVTSAQQEQTGETENGEEQQEPEDEHVGEPGQPLRCLPCGHVFHMDCVDPWLLNTSGRCPTCQKKVEIKAAGNRHN